MQITTMGLVIREVKTGESDRIIIILTPKRGIISAISKGSLRLKNKLFSSTGLFCYSEFTLYEGKTMYTVNEAEVREVFFGIRKSIESMALAMYCSEIAYTLAPEGEDAYHILRLLLNSMHYISENKRSLKLIKNIFELRALCSAGYMPMLVACEACNKYDGEPFYFNCAQATLLCGECAAKKSFIPNIEPSALAAMRHIVFSEDEKLFAFTLAEPAQIQLENVVSCYIATCMDKPLRTLEFLKSVLI